MHNLSLVERLASDEEARQEKLRSREELIELVFEGFAIPRDVTREALSALVAPAW